MPETHSPFDSQDPTAEAEQTSNATSDTAAMLTSEAPESETTEPAAIVSIEALQAEVENYKQRYLESEAEMQNLRRRTEREMVNSHKFALESFVKELLPVKDSLDLGLQAAKEDTSPEKVLEGVELTEKQLESALTKFGVTELNPIGEKLNPELHHAISIQPSPEHEANTILIVVQKGYTLHERLIRPALVVVSS